MKEFFRIWDIAYWFYFIIAFVLYFRFAKKLTDLDKEVDGCEGLLIILFWPIFYPLYSYRLREKTKGE